MYAGYAGAITCTPFGPAFGCSCVPDNFVNLERIKTCLLNGFDKFHTTIIMKRSFVLPDT